MKYYTGEPIVSNLTGRDPAVCARVGRHGEPDRLGRCFMCGQMLVSPLERPEVQLEVQRAMLATPRICVVVDPDHPRDAISVVNPDGTLAGRIINLSLLPQEPTE